MPFTISHAAAVLPFARPLARWRMLSATVIGSMVPDFGFLMPWRPARVETHSAVGLLEFCLPVGLATFWIFQQLIKAPIVAILPDSPYARWRAFAEPARIDSVKQWAFAALGILAGAVTHLVWDGFTHEGARGVRMIPALDDAVDIGGHRLMGARLLQDGSSLIGLAIVIAIVAYALRTDGTRVEPERSLGSTERYLWILGYSLASLVASLLFVYLRHPPHHTQSIAVIIANCAVGALRGFASALIVVSLILNLRLRANASSRATRHPVL
jgi:hypothetical protein